MAREDDEERKTHYLSIMVGIQTLRMANDKVVAVR